MLRSSRRSVAFRVTSAGAALALSFAFATPALAVDSVTNPAPISPDAAVAVDEEPAQAEGSLLSYPGGSLDDSMPATAAATTAMTPDVPAEAPASAAQPEGAEPQARADGWSREGGAWRYYEGGKAATGFRDLPNRDDASRGTSRYWFEADGALAADKAFYDRPSDGWYWADADGTVARNKDAFVPASNEDSSRGKWVRLDAEGRMLKGEDYRGGAWYYFDPVTSAMAKGFAYVPSGSSGKWCYYDRVTGKMAHGEVYVGGAYGDEPGWCLFDCVTGAMRYGFQDLGDKTVYYDEVTGRMVHGWRTVEDEDGLGASCHFDEVTGALLEKRPAALPSKWIGASYSSPGRLGNDWDVIVIHIAECPTLADVDRVFTDGGRRASAHYAVGDSEIHQYVNLGDTAWAVGNWSWNLHTVSIEHVGTTQNPPTRATLDTSARLMASLARMKGWTRLVLGENVGIHKWYSATDCPGPLDVTWLVKRANEYLGSGVDGSYVEGNAVPRSGARTASEDASAFKALIDPMGLTPWASGSGKGAIR